MNRWLWGAMLITAFIGWQLMDTNAATGSKIQDSPVQREMEGEAVEVNTVPSRVQQDPLTLTVTLKQHYMDGVTETTHKEETIWSMVDFWAAYEGWTVVEQTIDHIVFQQKVKDISPLTKQKGYFGLTDKGELAVFQGIPGKGKVIESFKPIPLKPLESKHELKQGIKIQSYQHFQRVLKQYSETDEV